MTNYKTIKMQHFLSKRQNNPLNWKFLPFHPRPTQTLVLHLLECTFCAPSTWLSAIVLLQSSHFVHVSEWCISSLEVLREWSEWNKVYEEVSKSIMIGTELEEEEASFLIYLIRDIYCVFMFTCLALGWRLEKRHLSLGDKRLCDNFLGVYPILLYKYVHYL